MKKVVQSSEVVQSESGEKSAQIKHRLQSKTVQNQYVGGFWCEIHFFTEGSIIMDYELIF